MGTASIRPPTVMTTISARTTSATPPPAARARRSPAPHRRRASRCRARAIPPTVRATTRRSCARRQVNAATGPGSCDTCTGLCEHPDVSAIRRPAVCYQLGPAPAMREAVCATTHRSLLATICGECSALRRRRTICNVPDPASACTDLRRLDACDACCDGGYCCCEQRTPAAAGICCSTTRVLHLRHGDADHALSMRLLHRCRRLLPSVGGNPVQARTGSVHLQYNAGTR